MGRRRCVARMLLCVLVAPASFGQSGKIAGRVTDAETGVSLPGVNVFVEDTYFGAVTDGEGYYQIVGVRPGTYAVTASNVGYEKTTATDVRVSTGLTVTVSFDLDPSVLEGEEAIVIADRPVVQPDVSANVATIDAEEFVYVPVASVDEIIDLQAGIEPGMRIRGGDIDEIAFVVDGFALRSGRDQTPFINVAYTSLEQVQVQTGGFNAEYGNVRAGVVNVTTKEPSRRRYEFDGLFRYRPIQEKSLNELGRLPDDVAACGFGTENVLSACDTYFTRPYLDPDVAFEGTSVWDVYTRRQYQEWRGWNEMAGLLQADGFDVDPDDLIQHFLYTHRKDNSIQVPDYEADVTLGGPFAPALGRRFGDPRFTLSYRGTQTSYVIPQSRNHYGTTTWQGRLIANPLPTMKVSLHGIVGTQRGNYGSGSDWGTGIYDARVPVYPWDGAPDLLSNGDPTILISDAAILGANINHVVFGARFTHAVNPSTFYEVSLSNQRTSYRHEWPALQDGAYLCPPNGERVDARINCAPGYPVNVPYAENGRITYAGEGRVGQDRDGDGQIDVMCFGGERDVNGDGVLEPYCVGEKPLGYAFKWGMMSDTTDVGLVTGDFQITSQLNRYAQIKAGAELTVGDYDVNAQRDIYYSSNSGEGGEITAAQRWNRSPIQGGAYVQSKLEFQGMIANLGVRTDYFDANSPWWVFDPFDHVLANRVDSLDACLPKEDPDPQLFLSPRLGVSFPITTSSKLYFNYGHFRQLLDPFFVFGISDSQYRGIDEIGNPSAPMPKTVAYELGFDQNVLGMALLRVSAFYRDITAQPRMVRYTGLGGLYFYHMAQPWNYEDIRGFEITLSRHAGRYVRGFINYTYTQTKEGNFGYSQFHESTYDMREYLRQSTDYHQRAPLASPYARMNLILLSPIRGGGHQGWRRLLASWRTSLLGEWRSGPRFVWTGGEWRPQSLGENVKWRDFWNVDLRISRDVALRSGDIQFFAEVDNVLNRRHLWSVLATAGEDYMKSLHLPEDIFDDLPEVDADLPYSEKTGLNYIWVPGGDQPGDFRKPGVPFQPIEAVASLDRASNPNTTAWYWAKDTGTYHQWTGAGWDEVPEGDVKRVLDTKAYIDMPNARHKTFMNPRSFRLGLRVRL